MLKSMTGYGQAVHDDKHLRVSAVVKTINAKHADVSLCLPHTLAAYELAWSRLASTQLERGRITLTVRYERKDVPLPSTYLNPTRFKAYYHTLQALAAEVGAPSPPLFQLALHAPEVLTKTNPDTTCEADQPIFEKVIQAALQQCDQSRQTEGAVLANQLVSSLQHIQKNLNHVVKRAPARTKAVREKLRTGIQALAPNQGMDENRLEQELIYYAERLDITEEQVRLAQHLAYFEEVMHSAQAAGPKLSFIAQEIGREINTIGAKANDAPIQKEVVHMKDALAKIKEQLQNIL